MRAAQRRTLFVVEQELLISPGLQTGSLHRVPVSDYYSISLPESQGTVAAHHDDLTPLCDPSRYDRSAHITLY